MKQVLAFCIGVFLCGAEVCAQKQLVLLKRERVVLRLYPGDEFIYRRKNSKAIRTTYVNNLLDHAVVTHRDTVPYHEIDRVYFRQHKFYNLVGSALVMGGAGLFMIDQVNQVIVQGNGFSLDDGVTKTSIGALTVGLPLMLIKKKSERVGGKYAMMTVKEGSIFYQPDPRGFTSPYIDN